MEPLDFPALASELLRSWRGHRSQTQLARRLGYRSNVATTWETGRRFPSAATALQVAERTGVDVRAAVARFLRVAPAWLDQTPVATPDGVSRLLRDLRGTTPIGQLADRAGASRFAVSRWLKGTAQPRLPDFLALIEATSLRVLDLLAELCDITQLPSACAAWARLEEHRRVAYDVPWSQAILRALELGDYRSRPHRIGWIAARLGIPVDDEVRCLEALARSGQIRWDGARWREDQVLTVDTRRDPAAGRQLKQWWARVGLDRLEGGDAGLFSYNVFTVSEADLERLRALHLAYFRELRAIVAESAPAERVVVANVQLFGLDRSGR